MSRSNEAADRRQFLSAVGAWAAAASLSALGTRVASGASLSSQGYGPLRPAVDETTGWPLLRLPAGFRYLSYGWTGDPMDDGHATPDQHDGMGVIAADGSHVTLCRNHEVNYHGEPIGERPQTFDPQGPAGCTNLEFDLQSGRWTGSWCSIAGTSRNCAGGVTPWNTWLTCEETVLGPGDVRDRVRHEFQEHHGWIFEVPPDRAQQPQPLRDMGRFVHEAVAVDPRSSIVYETEDRETAGFYRFLPHQPRQLAAGGRLQMLQAVGAADLRRSVNRRQFDVRWVDIDDPQRAHEPGTKNELGVFKQGQARGGTTFARLEGCWFAPEEGLVYFDATSGGDRQAGQIWCYDPGREQLSLVFESPGKQVLDMPDNICVSPQGAIVMCEDGSTKPQRLHGLTADGRLFTLAENNLVLDSDRRRGNIRPRDYRDMEWCGACFSPDGQWLFVNIQTPGVTFAITGPWADGPL